MFTRLVAVLVVLGFGGASFAVTAPKKVAKVQETTSYPLEVVSRKVDAKTAKQEKEFKALLDTIDKLDVKTVKKVSRPSKKRIR